MNLWQHLATICFATNWSYKSSTNVERNVTKVSTTASKMAKIQRYETDCIWEKMWILANYVYIYIYVYVADDLLCNQCWLGYSAFHHLFLKSQLLPTQAERRGGSSTCPWIASPRASAVAYWSLFAGSWSDPFVLVNVPSVGTVSLWFAKLTLVTIVQLP